ncbi:MAG: hypothetical protein ACQEUT_19980 [Bacillota bacterium]
MIFEEIIIKKHRDTVVDFHKDSFYVSFGDTAGFGEEEGYINWLDDKIRSFSGGVVLAKENGNFHNEQAEESFELLTGKSLTEG